MFCQVNTLYPLQGYQYRRGDICPPSILLQPGLLNFLALAWSIIEFEGLASTCTFGSSGRELKYWSRLALNSSILTLVRSLVFFGRELKILVRVECVCCLWLLAQTKVATIFDIFPHVGVGVVLTLLPFTPEGIVVGF